MADKNLIIEFLYQSISDAQQTIRSIDVKIGFIFLILFAPLPILKIIYHHALIDCQKSWFGLILVTAATLFWSIAAILQFMALAAITDPGDKILRANDATGSFFLGDLYSFNFIETVFGSRVQSKRTLKEQIDSLPKNEEDVVKELTYERMKLSFIVSAKASRSRLASIFTVFWLLLAIFLYIFSKAL